MKWKPQILVLGASVFSAMTASLCCIGPIAVLLLGVSGVTGATLFAKWPLPFLGVTIVFLCLSWYLAFVAHRRIRCENSVCATPQFGGWKNIVLWVATVFVIAMIAFPMWSNSIVRPVAFWSHPAISAGATPLATLHARIPSMDCPACAIPIRMKLYRQPGISSVAVSFESKDVEVQYDPAQISSEQIISKINETGFRVEPTTPLKSR